MARLSAGPQNTTHFGAADREQQGVLLLADPIRRVRIGTLDALGALALVPQTPPLAAGVTNDVMHLQPVFADASGGLRLGCAELVVRVRAPY